MNALPVQGILFFEKDHHASLDADPHHEEILAYLW
jgi:hypothetical protein